jgi:hypothetical protein
MRGLFGAFFQLVVCRLGLSGLGVEHVHGADQQQHAAAHLKARSEMLKNSRICRPSRALAAITQRR